MAGSFSKLTNQISCDFYPWKTLEVNPHTFPSWGIDYSITPWKCGGVLEVKCFFLTFIKIWGQVSKYPLYTGGSLGLVLFGTTFLPSFGRHGDF